MILTGSGFTANWGTPTAQGVWAEIIADARLKAAPKIKDALLSGDAGFDYESILMRSRDNDFGVEEAKVFETIIEAVYGKIETILESASAHLNTHNLRNLVRLATPTAADSAGFVFTLNQDLLLERSMHVGEAVPDLCRPGVPQKEWSTPTTPVQIGTVRNRKQCKFRVEINKINYVKLHGSVDWRTEDNRLMLIVGGRKEKQIDSYSLLKWNFDLFKSELLKPNKKLLIIGYGFRDLHINKALNKAVKKSDLGIHIWDYLSPGLMRSLLAENKCHIWQNLIEYSTIPLHDVIFANAGLDPLRFRASEYIKSTFLSM